MKTGVDPHHVDMMGTLLLEVARCPHCDVAAPNMIRLWASVGQMTRQDEQPVQHHWGVYGCYSCGGVVAVKASRVPGVREFAVDSIFPSAKVAHEDLPPMARKYLQQAFQTLQAPDAAAMVAGSAVDAMLKAKGYEDGSLYTRIDAARADGLLTQGMADWAHSVRLGANRPRHADADRPHVSHAEARQSVDFAEALGTFLFVLTARINRGIEAAQTAEQQAAD